VVNATPWAALAPGKVSGTHCSGGLVDPWAGLDGAEKFAPAGIRSPDHPARSDSLYRPAIRAQAVMMNIIAFRNVWSFNLVDIYVRFGRTYCPHFQCGSGTWCFFLNLTGVLCYKISVNLDQNTWGSVTKDGSL